MMNQLHRDLILYLFDFLIIPPRDFVHVFSLNRHWRECTEFNDEFWERQLGAMMYLLDDSWRNLKQETESSYHTNRHRNRRYLLHLNSKRLTLDEFRRTYFFKEHAGSKRSLSMIQTHPVFVKVFGKLNHDIDGWMEEKSRMNEGCFGTHTTPPMGHRMENDLRSMKSKRQVSIQSMFISAFARIKEKGLSSNFFTTRKDKQIASWAFVSDLITSCEYFKYFTDFDYYREYIYTGLRVFTKPQIDNSIPCWEYILTLRTLTNKSDIISLQRMVFDWAILRPYKNDPYTVILNFLQSTSDMLANFMDRGEAETVSLQVALNSIFDGITDYLKCKLSVERRTNFMKNLIFHLIQGSFNNSTSCMAISIFKQFKQYFQPSYSDLFQQPLHKYIQVRSYWITSFPVPTINTDNQLLLLEYFLNSLSFSTKFLLKFTLTRKNGAAFAKIGFLYYASPNAKPTCDFIKYSRITDVDDIIRTVLECRKVYEKFGKMKRFEKDFERRVNDLCFSNDIIMKLFKLRIISNSFRDNYIKDMLYSIWNRDTISDFDHTLTTILQQTQTMLSEYNFHEETTFTNNSLEQIKIPCKYLTELHFDYWELKESAEKFPKSILNQKSIEFKRVGHDCLFQSNPVGLLLLSLRVVKKHDADALQKALNHAFFTQFWNSTVTVPYLYDCLYPQPVAIGNEMIYCKENSYGDDYYRRVYLKKMTVKQLLQEILEQSHILEKKKKPNTTLY